MHSLGKQIVAEFYRCAAERLTDVDFIEKTMAEAARRAGATIVTQTFHAFSPHGVSGVVVIAESHLAIHTWPEYGYAAVDLFTCGADVSAARALNHLRTQLEAEQVSTVELRRGQPEMMRRQGPAGDGARVESEIESQVEQDDARPRLTATGR